LGNRVPEAQNWSTRHLAQARYLGLGEAGGCMTVGRGVSYTLHHMDGLMKKLEFRVPGVHIA
jgi:hypothetical protein